MSIYLYVKTHQKTGLKYLGMTTRDPYQYKGSGVWWWRHLSKYGYEHDTEVLHECQSKDKIKELGIYYSRLWNVVESDDWANLKEETGDGGDTSMTPAFKLYQKTIAETKTKFKWWNNGDSQVHAETPPDNTYTEGRLAFNNKGAAAGTEKQRGKSWVTNGKDEFMTHDEPPAGYRYGRAEKSFRRKTSPKGTKWWTNGVTSKMSKERPGDDFVPGRSLKAQP